jgi:hypothetical protein
MWKGDFAGEPLRGGRGKRRLLGETQSTLYSCMKVELQNLLKILKGGA